jgi:hypothetical protein
MRLSERDSSGTTVAHERSEGAKVMERIARRERPQGAKRLAQIINVLIGRCADVLMKSK